jgi:hypothetical protein
VFTRLLLDMGLYITGMVFAAGFRDLIRRARPDYEWVGALVFGAWVVWIGVSLVANGLEGGSALDALRGDADPSAVRALTMGTLLIYNGAIAFAMTALFLGAAGYATFATGVLPRWTGWLAYLGIALCVASVPALFGGPVDSSGFYNAGAGDQRSWPTSHPPFGSWWRACRCWASARNACLPRRAAWSLEYRPAASPRGLRELPLCRAATGQ